MFVPAPKRTTNGTTDSNNGNGQYAFSGDYSSVAAAIAALPAPTTNSGINLTGKRIRSSMQKGVLGYRRYKPTGYDSFALAIEYLKQDLRGVDQTRVSPSPLYRASHIKLGYNYTGGFTGLGKPWEDYSRGYYRNTVVGNLNRAAILNTENRAKAEAINKARNQKLDLSESLVDIDKTVLMVARRAGQVITAWNHVRHGKIKQAFNTLGLTPKSLTSKELAKKWLELQYGWLPLLNDIHDGVSLVNTGLGLPESTFTVSRNLTQPLLPAWSADIAVGFGGISQEIDVTASVRVKHRTRIKNATVAYLTSLGLENPAYLIWVGTPFTFVVDWLLPVSDWLQAITAPLGLSYVNGYMSTHIEGVLDTKIEYYSPTANGQNVRYKEGAFHSRISFVELRREAFTGFPTWLPYFRFPFSNPKRIVTTVALLEQQRRR